MEISEITGQFEALENPRNVEGMARFGIKPKTRVFGISIPNIRKLAKKIGKNHKLALRLWDLKIHEARILAGLAAEPERLTESQIRKWAKEFDSWDVCDQVCMNLFDKSPIAKGMISEFSESKQEFVKRTAFSLIAALASHDKQMKNKDFAAFLPIIKRASADERNFVKKAVNWALRGIGKRNRELNRQAIKAAEDILKTGSKPAAWIAKDALRELRSDAVQKRLK